MVLVCPCGKGLLDFVCLSSAERDGYESIVKRLVDEPETAGRRAGDVRRNTASSLFRLTAVYQSLLCGLEKDPILDGQETKSRRRKLRSIGHSLHCCQIACRPSLPPTTPSDSLHPPSWETSGRRPGDHAKTILSRTNSHCFPFGAVSKVVLFFFLFFFDIPPSPRPFVE